MRVTVTSKGQMTIPKAIRDKLSLDKGTQIELVENERGEYVMIPITHSIFDLRGFLPKPEKHFSTEELTDAIGNYFGKEEDI